MAANSTNLISVEDRPQPARRGLTLVEVVVSTLIVGVLMVATLNALGAATSSGKGAGNRAVAIGLADDLMAEILKSKYVDPGTSPVFGLETGESNTSRAAFNDVDDYNGWSEQPPQARDGTALTDRADYRRRVTVDRVTVSNPATTSSTETGVKRIRVDVDYKGTNVVEQTALRTDTDQ
jgi:prepilin-type N-terminal cleavage/methylation domain-containing protein